MKIALLLLAIPFVTASIESPTEIGDDAADVSEHLLDADVEGPLAFVLADLDRRNRVQPAYCYGTTDFNCYR